ncbi:MAG TPA: hypothetical protein VKU01_06815 [Bryobacteraceae bacterium]|nr:hypothetical protein [Bryobacteraceae bacterium]
MVDRANLIAYLLHEMPESERHAFAERCFSDPEFYEALQMAEADLLDSYVRGTLSRSQGARVERYLLASDHQREKLAFARGLRAVLPAPRRRAFPVRAISAAAAIVVLAGALLWLGLRNRTLEHQIAELRQPRPVAGGVYSVFLGSGTLRGAESATELRPSGAALVRMELELEPGQEQQVYSATILRAGETVWTEAPLKPEHRGQGFLVLLWVPQGVLSPGNYTARLDAHGHAVGYYSFKVSP